MRDEVCAEWSFAGAAALHLHCHVSGAALWLAPARYRNFVFKREMPLVLDCILYAERDLLGSRALWEAPIFIHFEALEARSLPCPPRLCACWSLQRVFAALAGMPGPPRPALAPAWRSS